jgi:hypothetical protein
MTEENPDTLNYASICEIFILVFANFPGRVQASGELPTGGIEGSSRS